MPYDDRLMTMVDKIGYDFNTRQGTVWMEKGTCTDMPGSIRFFTQIDPSVRRIMTYAGEAPDYLYKLEPNGEWRAWDARSRTHSKTS
jgi:hypothetical protein